MITELDMLDHVVLDEEHKTMIMLIVDAAEIWQTEEKTGILSFRAQRLQKENNLKHLLYLKNKVESYVRYIENGGLLTSFPNCGDPALYSYDIHVMTNFEPAKDYLRVIDNLNQYIGQFYSNITVTIEKSANSVSNPS